MTASKVALITCDDCGDTYCCEYPRADETRERAREFGWVRVPQVRADGRTLWRDVCDACVERERGWQR